MFDNLTPCYDMHGMESEVKEWKCMARKVKESEGMER
jgi:hypothetical protein